MTRFALHQGDSREVLKTLAPASVDSVVCDPPYELGFMGKGWDSTGVANDPTLWSEVLRVLKPGGHLLAFSGTRTYHRMVCAIEDAGFEIRDQIFYVYGSGFPKSHNLDNLRGKAICGCEAIPQHDVRPLHETDLSAEKHAGAKRDKDLQPSLPEFAAGQFSFAHEGRNRQAGENDARSSEPSLEGRGDGVQKEGQLQGHPLPARAGLDEADGPEGRLHHGAPDGDGRVVRLPADTDGSGTSRRSRPDAERPGESGTVAGQPEPQAGGAWPLCGGCGKPILPRGLGTALKPAHEPIVLARKPPIGTVAANVLAHGTGALNIDGCRVGTTGGSTEPSGMDRYNARLSNLGYRPGAYQQGEPDPPAPAGRWPANLIHDGSDEVLAAFPDAKGQQGDLKGHSKGRLSKGVFGDMKAARDAPKRLDSGSAARFFYCAKASKKDRDEGLADFTPTTTTDGREIPADNAYQRGKTERKNNHPTVKPTDLMRYLCRLVTPPGGLVLDPFLGSGSTGKAAVLEGFRFVGFDLSAEYIEIARARIEFALRQGHQPSLDLEAA